MYVCCYSNRVRLAATKALLNSLEFTKANFEKEVHDLNMYMYMLKIQCHKYIHGMCIHI